MVNLCTFNHRGGRFRASWPNQFRDVQELGRTRSVSKGTEFRWNSVDNDKVLTPSNADTKSTFLDSP
jgi:hypothetical protein